MLISSSLVRGPALSICYGFTNESKDRLWLGTQIAGKPKVVTLPYPVHICRHFPTEFPTRADIGRKIRCAPERFERSNVSLWVNLIRQSGLLYRWYCLISERL